MTGDDNEHGGRENADLDATEIALGPEVETLLADAATWEQPPADLGERIVAGVRSEAVAGAPAAVRRSPHWIRPAVLGAAAVVAFLFVGVVALSAVGGSTGADQFSADLVPTGLIDGVDGSIEMASFDSGLRIELDAPSLPRREGGQFYEAWLRTEDGLLVPVGTFHGGDAVTLWAGVERHRVTAFSVTLEEAVGPDSVDQRTSGRVVLKVDIPAP